MKHYKIFVLLLGTCIFFTSCKKDELKPLPIKLSSQDSTFLKIVYASAYTINYKVQLKTNNIRVSNLITYSTPFPGGGVNTGGGSFPDYMSVVPGSIDIAVSIPNANTNTDSVLLSKNVVKLEGAKTYSVYLTDTSANTQAVVVPQNITPVEGDFSRLKFINLIPNTVAIDLYFGSTIVASNVAYKAVSAEFLLPRGATGRWSLRKAGDDISVSPIAAYPVAANSMITIPNRRLMSVFSRGYLNGAGNLAAAVSYLFN